MQSDYSNNKNGQKINFQKVKIDLLCEWKSCNFVTDNLRVLKDHIINHLRVIFKIFLLLCCQEIYNTHQLSVDSKLECGICSEKLCPELSSIRHLNFHAYMFNLKSRGRYLKKLYKLNDCQVDMFNSNEVPPLTESFDCQWDKCVYSSEDISEFFDHIDNHPYFEDYEDGKANPFICKWRDCKFSTCTIYRLLVHLKVHCEKRYVACPKCGTGFSTTSKFTDHLKRQIVNDWYKQIEEQEVKEVLSSLSNKTNPVIPITKPVVETPRGAFKCNLCQHLFATKAMLKEHERRHISSLTCPHCNHSCSTRYALKRHILFRHTEEKPFSCNQCDRSFKCNDVLRRHIAAVHPVEEDLGTNGTEDGISQREIGPPFRCTVEPDCSFMAKNKRALQIHRGKAHCQVQTLITKVYVCHKCDQEFVKGSLLTGHLTKEHGIRRLSNRVRHQYKICKDGKYRLNLFDIRLKSVVAETNESSFFNETDMDADVQPLATETGKRKSHRKNPKKEKKQRGQVDKVELDAVDENDEEIEEGPMVLKTEMIGVGGNLFSDNQFITGLCEGGFVDPVDFESSDFPMPDGSSYSASPEDHSMDIQPQQHPQQLHQNLDHFPFLSADYLVNRINYNYSQEEEEVFFV